ncbi:hypothetical protein [Glutamicibacter sp. NPDC127525]|uniref:hypothetical protein n=1 Tax=unclassified Glutamicibacter TaxID=2627139 RepID=UPI003631AE1E
MAEHRDSPPDPDGKLNPVVERSKFGVSKKPKHIGAEESRAPMTSSELSKGPGELAEQP